MTASERGGSLSKNFLYVKNLVSLGKSVRVFDTKKQERLHEFKLGYLWGTPILCVSISLNGSYVCAGNERTIHVYDCNNPKVDLVFKPIQPCTCAFALNDGRNRLLDECYIFAICRNSSFFRYAFNPSKAVSNISWVDYFKGKIYTYW